MLFVISFPAFNTRVFILVRLEHKSLKPAKAEQDREEITISSIRRTKMKKYDQDLCSLGSLLCHLKIRDYSLKVGDLKRHFRRSIQKQPNYVEILEKWKGNVSSIPTAKPSHSVSLSGEWAVDT